MLAMPNKASTMQIWAQANQPRRCPKARVNHGSSKRSTKGAQTNLKEYPKAAQLKKVTALRSTPASSIHNDRDEKISNSGNPAEKPSKTITHTRRCPNNARLCAQPKRGSSAAFSELAALDTLAALDAFAVLTDWGD
jgi:hypothetical protein